MQKCFVVVVLISKNRFSLISTLILKSQCADDGGFDGDVCFSLLKASTVAVATCSVPFTVILTNTTVPTITGVQLLPAYARRIPSWWLRKSRSYEDWAQKKESLTLWIWTMMTWRKTPEIMASFVHGSLRRDGRGGVGWLGRSHFPDASLTSISLSLQ